VFSIAQDYEKLAQPAELRARKLLQFIVWAGPFLGFVQSPHTGRKHACDQNAQRDEIGDMGENVSVVHNQIGRGAADRCEYRQAAGVSLKLLSGSVSVSSEKETKEEKQAQHFGQCQM
jgi:hypothetical protein